MERGSQGGRYLSKVGRVSGREGWVGGLILASKNSKNKNKNQQPALLTGAVCFLDRAGEGSRFTDIRELH